MSRANAQVRFPDGTIKYGIYNGTVDVYMEWLFDTPEEAWECWQAYRDSGYNDSKFSNPYDNSFFDVEIADDYGSGETYMGRASKSQIVSSTNADHMNSIKDGLPDWWVEGMGDSVDITKQDVNKNTQQELYKALDTLFKSCNCMTDPDHNVEITEVDFDQALEAINSLVRECLGTDKPESCCDVCDGDMCCDRESIRNEGANELRRQFLNSWLGGSDV